MDTLSHDSSSSPSITTYVAIGAGVLGVILAGAALFKLSALQKTVAAHDAEIPKIATLEGELRTATAKSESDLKGLQAGVQNALTQVGEQMGVINGKITKLEEAQKARPAAAGGKGAAAPTGVLNADGTYSVAPGDTLAKIARKFAVKVDAIEAENPGLDPARLKVGQKIRVPKK
jgi:LysM repeat protein